MATDDVADQLRAQGVGRPPRSGGHRIPDQPLQPRYQDAGVHRPPGRGVRAIQNHYAAYFGENSTNNGLLPQLITDKAQIRDLTAFFAWTAWAAAGERPATSNSYTNNWAGRAARRQRSDRQR
ncbi:hypothetical protein I545_3034 [Mycobacterium kansasii 662]|uniref:Nitric oxide reductase subunit B cytochrome c-like domain-containing protein n=1 Tax=Mycobacterium kansasii 662 TaxID=1299326 RepID=X7ZDW0_MYCKA|nr:hypothetical protein I545_3034 [Mycobacterium kansasii 662]